MSESLLNAFVAFVASFPSKFTVILLAVVSDVNADVLKNLSVTSNITVTFFLSWSIVVFAYSYMNAGFMKSTSPRSRVCFLL